MINSIKLFSAFLLVWYGIARWMVLAGTNQESIDWLANSTGNFVALLSIGYLIYTILNIDKLKNYMSYVSYIALSTGLWVMNAKFLADMIAIYLKSKLAADFGFVMLDIAILAYYTLILRYCYITSTNKTANSVLAVSVAE